LLCSDLTADLIDSAVGAPRGPHAAADSDELARKIAGGGFGRALHDPGGKAVSAVMRNGEERSALP
jgi:hypothetical protein